jgi:hypothetical protein
MIRHATEQAKPPHEINSSVPVGLSQLTLKLMEKKPEDRYQDPISACKVLMPFVSGDLEGLATPEADAKMKPYFTWLESEKHQSIEISNKTIPTGPSPVSPLNQEDPFKDVGPKSILPEAELSYQQAPVREGVTARELVFFVIGTLAGSLATAAGCYFGLKKQADPVQQSSSPLEEKR